MAIHVLAVALFFVALGGVEAQDKFRTASLSVSAITKKCEYNVGEEWVYTFKATATAPQDMPLKIRAWSQFYAAYDVIPEYHGPLADSTLSDVLATGGQIWRDGLPVVLWNAPDPKVFTKTRQTTIAAGKTASATFKHNFGARLKPGNSKYKLWFAIVVEPSPEKYMLLFCREPTEVEFTVEGEELDFDTYLKQRREWDKTREFQFHDEFSLRAKETTG